jgi:acylphosphatase
MYIAYSLKVMGFVQYSTAGDIVIEAEGDDEHLEQFIVWLRNFIKDWKISDFSIVETTPKGYSTFELRNGIYGEEAPTRKSIAIKLLNSFSMRMRLMFCSKKPQVL